MVPVSLVAYLVAGWLFLMSLYGIATSRNLIHLVSCLGLSQAAAALLLLTVGYRAAGRAPVLQDLPPGAPLVDPVVQALVLTDIVVGAAVSALLLSIAIQAKKRFKTLDPDRLRAMRG